MCPNTIDGAGAQISISVEILPKCFLRFSQLFRILLRNLRNEDLKISYMIVVVGAIVLFEKDT